MSHNPAPAWYKRHHEQGESYTSIAKSAHVSRNRVAGAIKRYRDQLGKPAQPKPAKPKSKASSAPQITYSRAKRQAVDPAALARFDAASAARTCLWIEGDLRDGKTAVCGMRREHGVYCGEHRARVYPNPKQASAR